MSAFCLEVLVHAIAILSCISLTNLPMFASTMQLNRTRFYVSMLTAHPKKAVFFKLGCLIWFWFWFWLLCRKTESKQWMRFGTWCTISNCLHICFQQFAFWRCWNNQQVTVITPVVVNLRLSLRAIHWMSPELADTVLVRHVRNLKAAWSSIWWTYQNSSKFTFAQLLCPAWACFWISRSNRKIGQPVRTSHSWSPLHCTKCSVWAQ